MPAAERHDPQRRRRDRWMMVESVSSLATILAAHYFSGAVGLICTAIFAVLFGVSVYFTFRYSPAPFTTPTSLTR
ncbi:MAG: hypothetical protein ACRD1V_16430 [Vicinamibacterales bacterium]